MRITTSMLLLGGRRSGTVWFASPEWAVTAAHCVADRHTGKVFTEPLTCELGRNRLLEVKDLDPRLDVAILSVKPTVPREACLNLGSTESVPLNDARDWVSFGYVDAKPDGLDLNGRIDSADGSVEEAPALQLTCNQGGFEFLNGCSGAPVIRGNEVIGVIRWGPPELAQKVIFASRMDEIVERFADYIRRPVAARPLPSDISSVVVNKALEALLAKDQDVNLFAQSYAPEAYRDFADDMRRARKIALIAEDRAREAVIKGIYEALDFEQDGQKKRKILEMLSPARSR
jgi:hypothetical protein